MLGMKPKASSRININQVDTLFLLNYFYRRKIDLTKALLKSTEILSHINEIQTVVRVL